MTSPDGHNWEVFTILEDLENNKEETICCTTSPIVVPLDHNKRQGVRMN